MIHGITKPGLVAVVAVMEQQLREARAIRTGCRDCEHNSGGEFKCAKAGGQPVPQEHRESGCDLWQWNSVPFSQRAPAPQTKPALTFTRKPSRPGDFDEWSDDIPF